MSYRLEGKLQASPTEVPDHLLPLLTQAALQARQKPSVHPKWHLDRHYTILRYQSTSSSVCSLLVLGSIPASKEAGPPGFAAINPHVHPNPLHP